MKSYIREVAELFGVEVYEEFKIQPSIEARFLGHKDDGRTFRFDSELSVKGYSDDWSQWYGSNSEILYRLIIGLYEVVKISEVEE